MLVVPLSNDATIDTSKSIYFVSRAIYMRNKLQLEKVVLLVVTVDQYLLMVMMNYYWRRSILTCQ